MEELNPAVLIHPFSNQLILMMVREANVLVP